MKSGYSEKDIDKVFHKRATIPRRKTLKKKSNKKQNNEIKLITKLSYHCLIFIIYGEQPTTFQKIMKN